MADEWVGIRTQLPNDPKMIGVANWLANHEPFRKWLQVDPESLPRNVIMGVTLRAFVKIWSIGNARGVPDGNDVLLLHCDFSAIDEIGELPGIAEAMAFVRWLRAEEYDGVSCVRLPNFKEYNTPVEDRSDREKVARENNRLRQKRFRERNKSNVTITPCNAPTLQNTTEHHSIIPPTPTKRNAPNGGMTEGVNGHEVSWDEVMTRLGELGVVQARQAVAEARDGCNCTPELAMRLIDYARDKGLDPGALVWRFKRAVPSLAIEQGWPKAGDDSAAVVARIERKSRRKRLERAESEATAMIKAGRRAGKSDEDIRAELKAKNLEWPK